MTLGVPIQLRQQVEERAHHRCEYCLLPQAAALHLHEIDHIVPRQHGGETHEDNLALACIRCNRYKGPNVGSFDPVSGVLVPFFNPRLHNWADHFGLDEATIVPHTSEGRVTVKILRLNTSDRITERQQLLRVGLYG